MTSSNYLYLFECATESDTETAIKLLKKIPQKPPAIILKREDGKLLPTGKNLSEELKLKIASESFDKVDDIFVRLRKTKTNTFNSIAQVKLVKAEVLDDCLIRFKTKHEKAANIHSCVDFYPLFTDANFNFFSIDENFTPLREKIPSVIGPHTEDIRPMLLDNCYEYFPHPRLINIDLTRACNKRCEKCMYHAPGQPFEHSTEEMDIELAKKILDDAATLPIPPTIHTSLSGEPLLYKHLEEFFAHAKKLKLNISTTTNGVLLNDEKIDMLLNYNVSMIAVSIDSINQKTYQRLQGPGEIDPVIRNVERLIEKRGERAKPKIQTTFVIDKNNSDEFPEYLEFWMNRVDMVTRTIRLDNAKSHVNKFPLFFEEELLPCPTIWTSLKIWPNGNVAIPCCYDMEGDATHNLNTMSIMDIWKSGEFMKWRKILSKPNSTEAKLFCKKCIRSPFAFRTRKTAKYSVIYTHESETYTNL